MTIYPGKWIPWRFTPKSQPPELFKSTDNQRKFIEYLAVKYGLKQWTDYYRFIHLKVIVT